MATSDFCVILENDGWKIRFNGRLFGRFHTLQPAFDAAVRAAEIEEKKKKGDTARVLVEGADGELQLEWTFEDGFCGPLNDEALIVHGQSGRVSRLRTEGKDGQPARS